MFATVTPRTNVRSYTGYGAKRPAGGGGAYGQKSKRGAKASSVMSKAKGVKYVKQTPASIIKRVVRSLAEKKNVNADPAEYTFNAVNSTMSAAVSLTSPIDNIAQGVTDGSRVGNRIRLAKYTLKMTFNPVVEDTAVGANITVPMIVQLFIGYKKDDPGTTPNAADLAKIYQDGQSTSGVDGTMLATLRDINTDFFKIVAYKKFKLGHAVSQAPTYSNNDFPLYEEVVINDLLKGEVTFNDTTASSNKHLYMWATFSHVDSVVTSTASLRAFYYLSVQYTDL